MDYFLDIIISKKDVEVANLTEKLISWGGNVFRCEPPQYIAGSDIIFEQVENLDFFSKIISEELSDDDIVLHLKSDIVFDLEYVVNKDETALKNNKLLVFLVDLFKLNQFYILLFREDEKIKERYKIVTKEEISLRLSDSLKWNDPKDVIIYKKN